MRTQKIAEFSLRIRNVTNMGKAVLALKGDFVVLLFLNVLFAFNYLTSTSDRMIGFVYRQDAYWYMIIADHLQRLVREGFLPIGTTWLKYAYCGMPEVVCLDPLYLTYMSFQAVLSDPVFSYKLTVFVFYVLSSIAMYYLTYVLTSDRTASLVASTAYTFSQVLIFEMFLGHLSMVAGFAFVPLVLAFYVKAVRGESRLSAILSALFLSALLLIRPDLAYFLLSLMMLFLLYFLYTTKNRIKKVLLTGILFLVAFLIAYPVLEPRYLTSAESLSENVGTYTYAFYSPEPSLLFSPTMKSTGVYLGITVLFFCAVAALFALREFFSSKGKRLERTQLVFFLLTSALAYVILGLGAGTPLYGLLYENAPFFPVFRVPTRWLSMAQLCLSIIAGIGVSYILGSLIRKTTTKRILAVTVILTIFFDFSIYIAPSVNTEYGWRPIVDYGTDSAVFAFPQTSYTPEKNAVYDYISKDKTADFRILSAPIVYSRSYYQSIQSLEGTDVTLAYDYVQFRLKSKFQTQLYNGFRYGNFTDSIGEQMALLGVKYLVYNFYWGEWEGLVRKMNRTEDLKFLLQDHGYILYQNKRFGDVLDEHNLIDNEGFERNDDFWLPWHVNEGISMIDLTESNSGLSSIRLSNNRADGLAGRTQYLDMANAPGALEFKLSGWGKAEAVQGIDALLAIRATVAYTDGSYSPSAYARFSIGTHDWEYSSVDFRTDPAKVVRNIVISFFLRNATGKAWFDDIYMTPRRLADEWSGGYPVKRLFTDVNALLSEQNKANATLKLQRENSMTIKLHVQANEPSFLILSESYDEGWRCASENTSASLEIIEYNSLAALFISERGTYDLTLHFTRYFDSLTRILFFHGAAVVTIALVVFMQRLRKVSAKIWSLIRSAQKRRLYY